MLETTLSSAPAFDGLDGILYTEHSPLTPLGWGDVFHNRLIVSEPAMRLIEERGGSR